MGGRRASTTGRHARLTPARARSRTAPSRTAASSARLYLESAGKRGPLSTGDVPVGVAVFPHDLVRPVRALAEPYHHLTHWTEMPRGGHFAALEAPDLLVPDIRAFFRPLR